MCVVGSTVASACSLSYTRTRSTSRTIGSVMKTASDSSASVPMSEDEEMDLLLEAARRANWEAMHGPAHLRSGRFFISPHLDAHTSDWLSPTASAGRPPTFNAAVRVRPTRR